MLHYRSRATLALLCGAVLVLAQLSAAEPAAGAAKPVPPEGVAPFDPKPLMDKVAERITTDKYRFAVIGDSRQSPSFGPLAKYVDEDLKPDFVLYTGDIVQAGGGKAGPGNWEKLAKESGAALRARPWWPVMANHELAGSPPVKKKGEEDGELAEDAPANPEGLENFKRFFNLEREYYSFSFRNAVFIALPFPWPKDKTEKWLKEELKRASAAGKHIFVYNHNPFFTVGVKTKKDYPNKENDITKLFQKYGVRAVFSGHDHIYYRTIRSGIPYVISAGGGAKLYAVARKDEALPEDVYYGIDPETVKSQKDPDTGKTITPKKKYLLHNGATGAPDKVTDQPDQYAVIVDVDGQKITLHCYTAKGEQWDELILSK